MSRVEDYEELPDSMDADEVARCFEQLLRQAKEPGVSADSVIEALWHLADRQYHTYERLRPDLRDGVEKWLSTNWRTMSEWVDRIGMIAGAIGLPGVVSLLETSLADQAPGPLRDEIQETLREFRAHIEDPYWGLRR